MLPLIGTAFALVRRLPATPNLNLISSFHQLFWRPTRAQLLTPVTTEVLPNRGFKPRGKLQRRCKDCYMVCREERWYNLCKTHPRHKQMQLQKHPKNTWMLSHATQGKVRPW